MERLSLVLWRERELLDMLQFKLEVEQLVLASGRSRWLMRAAREVEAVLETIRETEVLRAVAADEAAASIGMTSNPSLSALAEAAGEPWSTILTEHRDAFISVDPRDHRARRRQPGPDLGRLPLGPRDPAVPRRARRRLQPRRLRDSSRPPATAWSTGACDMSATFASFNTALSALRYNQVLMDTASGNIANVSTEGYARRRAVGETDGCAGRAGDVEPVRRLRRRRPRRAASTGWSTRSSTPARDASTATRPTSTPGRRPWSGSRPGSASPAPNGVSAALADFRQGVARPRQQPGLRRRAQPGARRGQHAGRRDQRPVAQRRDRGEPTSDAGC